MLYPVALLCEMSKGSALDHMDHDAYQDTDSKVKQSCKTSLCDSPSVQITRRYVVIVSECKKHETWMSLFLCR